MPSFFYTCQNILAQQNKMTLNTAEFIFNYLKTFKSLSCRCTNISDHMQSKGMKHFFPEIYHIYVKISYVDETNVTLISNYFDYIMNYIAFICHMRLNLMTLI